MNDEITKKQSEAVVETNVEATGTPIQQEKVVDGPSKKLVKGLILWMIVLAGYLLFCFNWMIMDNMKGIVGESGWYGSFFGTGYEVPSIVDQAPNWTLTFMRGVGAFFAGWVLVKIGHKYSVTIALGLLAFGGIIGPLTGIVANPEDATGAYGWFIIFLIFRMAMAVGATTLIVYTQPVITNYFDEKGKGLTNLFNGFAFNVGSIFAIAFLTYGLKPTILDNWILFTSAVSSIAIVLVILWLILAEPIATPHDPNDEVTYGSVLKEKRTIIYSIMFGLWLTWVVLFLTMLPGSFITKIAGANGRQLAGSTIGTWKILFLLGLFGGIPIFNYLNGRGTARKPIAMGAILIGVTLTATTGLIGAYGVDSTNALETTTPIATALFFITAFLAGVAGWGVQGYMLGTTYHYKGVTPKKQGIVIGACWGIGYMGETLLTIFSSTVNDICASVGLADPTTAWVFLAIYLTYCVMTAVMWIFIPETHGKNAHPDSTHYEG